MADLVLALDRRLAEIGKAALAEFGNPFQRFALGLEHGMDEVHAAALVGEHLGDEQALVELVALLGALLLQRPLGVDLLARGQERRIAGRDGHEQLADAQEPGASIRRFVVESGGVMAEEFFLHAQRLCLDRRCFGGLAGSQERFDFGEIFGGGLGVAHERSAEYRFSGRRRTRPDSKCLQRGLPRTSD